MTTLQILGWLGSVTFAASAALRAGRKQFDLFGTSVIALATALGGGTIRDVLLGQTPVSWIRNPQALVLVLCASTVTFVLMRYVVFPRRTLIILDALGLGVFAVLGCDTALQMEVSPVIAILMGIITGSAGGVIRDILCAEIPTILHQEFYATAALAGALVFWLALRCGLPNEGAMYIGIFATVCLRLSAVRWKIHLPKARMHGDT